MARFVGLSGFSLSSLFLAVLLFSSSAGAQIPPSTSTTSTPIPGAGHDYLGGVAESVNPVNGSVSFRIPVSMPPGRGITLPFSFAYDSNGVNYIAPYGLITWASPTSSITSQSGWSESVPVVDNSEITWTGIPDEGTHNTPCFAFVGYVYQDANGNRHNLDLTTYNETGQPSSSPCNNGSNWPFGFEALTVTQGGEPDEAILATLESSGLSPGPVSVTDGDGTVYSFSNNTEAEFGTMASSVTDRNGNFITINPPASSGSPYSYIDTAGRTVLQDSGFANSPESVSISGLGASYALTWTTLPTPSFTTPMTVISGDCGTPGHSPWYSTGYAGNGNDHVISQLTLPNGQSFTFTYNSVYGLVSQITYPTGGYVQYTWGMTTPSEVANFSTPQVSCYMLYGVPAITDRYVSFDGSTVALHQHYAYTPPVWADKGNNYSWTSKQTTVTTTDNVSNTSFTTVYNYSPIPADRPPNSSGGPTQWDPVESSIVYNDTTGSLLETIYKTWETTSLLTSQENTYPSSSGQDSETTWTYNTNGMQTQQNDYNFGTGAIGSLLRETVTNYAAVGTTHIVDKPSSIQTYDSTGTNLVAETDYAYDSYGSGGIASVTATNHNNTGFPPSYTTRGNVTSKTVKCLQSGCSNEVTTYTYDETGQILSMTDPCGNGSCSDMTGTTHTTNYSYADSYTSGTSTCTSSNGSAGNTNALLTLITYPPANGIVHSECFSYNYNSGELTGSKDENSQLTTYTYNDPLGRLTQANYPDGGQTAYSYNDSPYSPSTPSPSITTTKTISGFFTEASTTAFDGMNHKVETILSSDPDGVTYTATTYNGNGRPYQVYNPTRCSAITTNCGETTWGYTTTNYDGLKRVTSVVEQDNSTVSSNYAAFPCTTNTDEVGNVRKSCVDGLGRLTGVWEAPNNSSYNYETAYAYDPLNNLLTVNQMGGSSNSANWRTRTFTYDSLSRLLCAANPEVQIVTCPTSATGTFPSGAITYTYDLNGNVSTKVAPKPNSGSTGTVTTNYYYDVLNRLTQKSYVNLSTPSALYGYDGITLSGCSNAPPSIASATYLVGRRSAMCSGNSASSFSYDQMGRTLFEARLNEGSSANTYTTGYTYFKEGSLNTLTYPSGDVLTYTVGGAGRATKLTDSSNNYVGGGTFNATYAPNGSLVVMANAYTSTFAGIVTSNAYNDRLQPILLSASADSVSTAISSATYTPCSGACVSLNLYNVSSTTGINVNDTITVTGSHNPFFNGTFTVKDVTTGQVSTCCSSSSSSEDGELGTLIDSASSPLFSLCYDFHARVSPSSPPCDLLPYTTGDNGNVFQVTNNVDSTRSAAYIYDPLNRIAQAYTVNTTSANCWGETYSTTETGPGVLPSPSTSGIDAWGNLTQRTGVTGMTGCGTEGLSAVATTQNQLSGIGVVYDAAGNVVNDGNGNQPTYDAENRIVTDQGYTYSYDADGMRIEKASGSTGTMYWPGPGGEVLTETGLTGAINDEYVFFNGQRLASIARPSGDVVYYFADHLGSASVIAGILGNIQAAYYYFPFGGMESTTGSNSNHYKFTGKERDSESGLDNFGARYNASSMGRFMSPDPLGGSLVDPQTLNKYSYVRNNPINLTDPTGLYICADSKDGNNCTSDQDKAFEASRQRDLQSNNADVVRAASAYGDPNVDNHVNVGFADLEKKGEGGNTTSQLGADDKGNLFSQSNVTINSKISGTQLDAAVGHEGSHVADAQDLVKSITSDKLGNFKVGQDITQYQSEQRAYHVTDSIFRSANQTGHFNCGVEDCILGTGLKMPGQVTNEVDRILQFSYKSHVNQQPLTPANQGGSIVPH
jgi:RHS repeat-associated protein